MGTTDVELVSESDSSADADSGPDSGTDAVGEIDDPAPADSEIDEPGPGLTDAGMSTVEYAVGTVVAAAFAAVLYRIVTGDSVVAGLTRLVNSALNTAF